MARPIRENRAALLAVLLARHYPDAPAWDIAPAVEAMLTTARAFKQQGEAECNYPMTEAQVARADRALDRKAAHACELLHDLGAHALACKQPATLFFGGDCRGSCGSLYIPGTMGDGFDGPGWWPLYR